MELLAQHISQDHQITQQVLHKLIDNKKTRPLLITRSDWLYALAKSDEPLSHTIYQSLCSQLSEKECLEFTKRFQTLWRRPLLNYLLLLSAPNLIAILKQHSSYMFDAKEETIRQLSLGQFCILIQHLIGTEYPFEKHSHFSSFLLNIVKCSAQMVSHEDTASLIHRYLPFIKSNYPNEECILTLLEHIPEKHLSPESLAIKNTMMCSLHAEQVATADYIRWAVRQPLSDGILKQINQKITKKGFKNEEFSLLFDYFQHNPRLLRNLIKIGEAQNIEQNTLSRAIKVFFQGEKPLEEQLLLIEHMICKHYPETCCWLRYARNYESQLIQS
ncbi:MAG: hypothetical protein EB127_18500 [Alphaproteobacteria bacterium]|nr:hypothetical protein [Alphaproteobacteria bacterium]